jgi:hypothetical protein
LATLKPTKVVVLSSVFKETDENYFHRRKRTVFFCSVFGDHTRTDGSVRVGLEQVASFECRLPVTVAAGGLDFSSSLPPLTVYVLAVRKHFINLECFCFPSIWTTEL